MNPIAEIIRRARLQLPPPGAKQRASSIVLSRTRNIGAYTVMARRTHSSMAVAVWMNKEGGKKDYLGYRPAASLIELDTLFKDTCSIVHDVIEKYRQWLRGQTQRYESQEDPATPAQIRKIAQLAQARGIREPIEEKVRTKGEAGRMIRELAYELRIRGKK